MLDNGAFLLGAAEAGDLQVNPDDANLAVAKLGNVRDKLQALLYTMETGGQGAQLQLGDNAVGVAMAHKSQTKTSGAESLHAAVEKLHAQAVNAHTAVKRAMENYTDTDTANSSRFQH